MVSYHLQDKEAKVLLDDCISTSSTPKHDFGRRGKKQACFHSWGTVYLCDQRRSEKVN